MTEVDLTERLAAIVEHSNDAIIGKTLEGVIVSWNRAAERLYGFSAAEAVGKHISMIIPPEQQDELPAILETIALGGHVSHYETERVRKDGRRVAISVTVSPIRNRHGNIVGASAIARDITAQKALQSRVAQTRDWLTEAFRKSPAPTFIIKLDDLSILDSNESFSQLSGYTRKELLGGYLGNYDFLPNPDRLLAAIRELEHTDSFAPFELELSPKTGEKRIALCAGEKLQVAGEACMLGILIDITQHEQAEQSLLRTMQTVVREASLFSKLMAEQLTQLSPERSPAERVPPLSKRDRQFLDLIARGYNNKRIAAETDLAEQTVRNQIVRLYRKLQVNSRAEAVVWAREHHITKG
jgi:PAS domain S-box-containing protein